MDIKVSSTLLLVGKDRFLLQTRRSVLRTAGFAAILAERTTEACVAARYLRFRAVLLCHTFNESEQDQLIDDFHRFQSDVPMLRLTKNNVSPGILIGIVQQAVGGVPYPAPMPPQRGDSQPIPEAR